MKVEILFEDEHIIVCHKPAGIPTQTAKISMPDLVSILKNKLKTPYLAVIHRLDQPVEGILVFAKTPFAAKELNAQLQKNGGFGKHYQAILCGAPEEKEAVLEDYLVKDARTNCSKVCTATTPNAKKARLFYELLERYEKDGKVYSLVHVKLDTGRHHQIRVQMAHMGCPILGDKKYGNGEISSKLELCAYKLEFLHPKTKKQMVFEVRGLDKCAG